MQTFIKLYDWTLQTGLNLEERVILSLITQFSEKGGDGFWAGYKALSDRTGIPKSKCKAIAGKLAEMEAITITKTTRNGKNHTTLKTRPDFARIFLF